MNSEATTLNGRSPHRSWSSASNSGDTVGAVRANTWWHHQAAVSLVRAMMWETMATYSDEK
jgi:hypothetical protein